MLKETALTPLGFLLAANVLLLASGGLRNRDLVAQLIPAFNERIRALAAPAVE